MDTSDDTSFGGQAVSSGVAVLLELSRRATVGSIGLEAAKAKAAEHGAKGLVSAEHLVGLAEAAVDHAHKEQWRGTLELAEVSYEAARGAYEAHPDEVASVEAWAVATADLVEVLHGVLFDKGDIRLYNRARRLTETACEVCRRREFGSLLGVLSMRFGTLLVDAYSGPNRSSTNYDLQFGEWVARALQSGDPELIALLNKPLEASGGAPARGGWPEPLAALREAETYLRTALPLVLDGLQGSVLKALSQALEWQRVLGGESDPPELRSITEQALAALDPDDINRRLPLLATLQRLGERPSVSTSIEQLEGDLASHVAQTDERSVWSAISQAVDVLQATDPVRALQLLQRHRELEHAWSDESLRQRHFERELDVFAAAYRSTKTIVTDATTFAAALDEAKAIAASVDNPEEARVAAAELVHVMRVSSGVDEEAQALGLLNLLGGLDQSLWSQQTDCVRYLIASLWRGDGVNQWRAGAVDEAGQSYWRAANAYRQVGITVQMVQCVKDLCDVVAKATSVLDELTAWLATASLELELAAPSSAPTAVQELAARLLAAQVARGTSTEVVQMLLQIAKGRRFATLLASVAPFDPGAAAAHLFGEAAEAEAQLPEQSELLRPTPFDDGLGDDELVTAFVDEYESGPSETAADRVANLQRAAERQLSAALIPNVTAPPAPLAEIQSRLDSRTALLQLFEGVSNDGKLASWQFLVTRDLQHLAGGTGQMPPGVIRASWRGRTVTMPLTGMYVGGIRRAVQADPGPLNVAPEASRLLASANERYLRVLEQCLEPLVTAGLDRLVVVPHAASRFLPLHLAGPADHPLADRWTVTYLSNLAQLVVHRKPTQRRQGVGVFALSYSDQPRLPRLDDSIAEAEAIAAACRTTAVVDAVATEGAFRDALQSCRYVHLRAHGRLYVDAPSFHTIFLHPDEHDDGRLRAYEILPLDLAGLELVTLGACETALGRVDAGDNPRGLPAALVLAGAQAVIGTLWPVLAPASTCFFAELYRTLMNGDEDVRGAFAQAQWVTRREFPQYRDWGAFYLIGGLKPTDDR